MRYFVGQVVTQETLTAMRAVTQLSKTKLPARDRNHRFAELDEESGQLPDDPSTKEPWFNSKSKKKYRLTKDRNKKKAKTPK